MPPVRYHEGAFPPKDLDWSRLIPLIGPAAAAIARYDGVLEAIPNAHVLLSPLTTQEAVLSSRIEGTQATMGEVLEFEAGLWREDNAQKVDDIQEILNYRKAVRLAESQLSGLPLSGRLIRKTHKVLLEGVRGQNRSPGAFRKISNWIGPPGCLETEARFVPVSADRLADGMTAWEKYLHDKQPDALVQLAVLHAEFESLHPFLDGNGRLGRMLIPLFIFDKKLLSGPTFYLSEFLEARREDYYERLLAVSRDGDWTGWCVFFLKALREQADVNTKRARRILELYDSMKTKVVEKTHSQHAMAALDFIFDRPVFKAADFANKSLMPAPTARRILRILREEGILREIQPASGRRTAILAYPVLLNVAEGREVF